jgi:acetyltransferase-like isoleucine patch superfamily enzyme
MLKNYIRFFIANSRLKKIYHHLKYYQKYNKDGIQIGFETVIRNTTLKKDVYISDNCLIQNSTLGKNTYINKQTNIISAQIGNFCSIGSNVQIGVGNHPIDMISTHPAFYANNKAFITYADKMYYLKELEPIKIGNDVWIGSNVCILNNVTIGNGSIIAYGSVVTRNVPDFAIVAGVPARIVKFRFSEEEIKFINKSKWWDIDTSILSNEFKKMHNIQNFKDWINESEKNS